MRAMMGLVFVAMLAGQVGAQAPTRQAVTAAKGMVVAVSPPAVDIGVAILKKGGTAVDAAVAVAFAEAVTWPEAGNIGGGGFMLVVPPGEAKPAVIDYREMAPAAATPTMFAKDLNYQSAKVAGVPGTVRGLALAHKQYGKLPWKELVLPAAQLAEEGFEVDAALAKSLNTILADPKTAHVEFRRVYGKPGGTWAAGDRMRLPDLGKTLQAIAEEGPDAFYSGRLAELLVDEMKRNDGLITAEDLKNYQAKLREPIHGTYRGYDVYAPPPPSSGGITLMLMLNMLETFNLAGEPRTSPVTLHRIAEVMRRAYLDRARHLGDPDFTKIPTELTSKDYARKLAQGIDPKKATSSRSLAPDLTITDSGGTNTTHFSIIDGDGLAVSNTYTLENAFGNRMVVSGAGYILNNEMTDFNHRPGVTDTTGRIGTLPNQIAPGKRMLSSMCPTILQKDGKTILITGSPGGRTIINTVLNVVVNVVDYQMPIQTAVDTPRLHHQWFPDRISLESFLNDAAVRKALEGMGHTVIRHRQGDAHSIWIDPATGLRHGAADPRIDGKAAGY